MTGDCYVLGVGAMGGWLATRLIRSGWPCRALVRNPQRADLSISVTELDGTCQQYRVAVDQGHEPIHWLLITTKAHQTAAALAPLLTRLTDNASVLVLQNGLQGFHDTLAALPHHRILAGTTTEGVNRPTPDHWVHAGAGSTWIGPLSDAGQSTPTPADPTAQTWVAALQRAGLACHYDPDIAQRLWHKLLINSAINPLTVLFDCPNGDLLTRPEAHQLLELLCAEAVEVMAHQPGIRVPDAPLATVESVARLTARNISSMLQDARRGRDTEIDAITGYLIAQGEQAGLPCPTHRNVLQRVKRLTARAQA